MDNKQKALAAIRKHPLASQQLLIQLTGIDTVEWIKITKELEKDGAITSQPTKLGIDILKPTNERSR